jgi:SAM-dependent methyltransferase
MKGSVDFGDLRRFTPFCTKWGTTRGCAIDRYFIDPYLELSLRETSGRYLECGGIRYRNLVRNDQVASYDVLDVRENAPGLTIQADLHDLSCLQEGSFDVIICTQVLQYVASPSRCVGELHRILTAGGTLLISVPFIEKDYVGMGDRWRFTRKQVVDLLQPFQECSVQVRGNLLSSIAYLEGLSADDIDSGDLTRIDPVFYQLVLASARK